VVQIGRTLTDNGTEFKGKPTHPFEARCIVTRPSGIRQPAPRPWRNRRAAIACFQVWKTIKEMLGKVVYAQSRAEAEGRRREFEC